MTDGKFGLLDVVVSLRMPRVQNPGGEGPAARDAAVSERYLDGKKYGGPINNRCGLTVGKLRFTGESDGQVRIGGLQVKVTMVGPLRGNSTHASGTVFTTGLKCGNRGS